MSENSDRTGQNETSVEDLFQELKEDLTFLPDNDEVKEGYLFVLKWLLFT